MNASSFTQAAVAAALTVLAVSCSTANSTRSYPEDRPVVVVDGRPGHIPPGQMKKYERYEYRRYPLIVVRTPSIVIQRYSDGRDCYVNPAGYYYWKGFDNRFYLDERYLSRVDYNDRDYRDWKYKGKYYKERGRGHGRYKDRDRDDDDDR